MRRPLVDIPNSRRSTIIKNRLSAQRSYLNKKQAVNTLEKETLKNVSIPNGTACMKTRVMSQNRKEEPFADKDYEAKKTVLESMLHGHQKINKAMERQDSDNKNIPILIYKPLIKNIIIPSFNPSNFISHHSTKVLYNFGWVLGTNC